MSTSWPVNVGRIVLAEVDSTNAQAARIAPTLTGPTWILGLKQTAGRGRRGRDWKDQGGNFAATYVYRPSEPADKVALRSFVAAVALRDALVAVTGRPEGFGLKWPNDVLLNGGKLAGILLESHGSGASVNHLAVGIGVNLLHAPQAADIEARAVAPVSLLSETGANVTPEEFLDALAPAFAHREQQMREFGFEPIRAAWLTNAARLGEIITARTGTDEVTGTFETVDEAGNLVLSTAKGRRAIPAAEVFF